VPWGAGPFQTARAIAPNPTTLPGSFIERPTRYALVINLKAVQALGLTIPSSLLFQADEVLR
jgi:hypothetical protein